MHSSDNKHRHLKCIVVRDAMNAVDSPLITNQELVESIRKVAIYNWGDRAREKLAELGLTTDEDLHNYMAEHHPMIIEDPDPNTKDFYGKDIIPD